MKKSIFKAYWLVALTICMLASCTSQKEEIETNNTTPNEIVARKNVRSRSTLPPVSDIYDLPAYIGALHNAGIYAFINYVNENNLSPFTECEFTDEMIETFAQNYVIEHLCDFEYLCDFDIELDTNILTAYGMLLDSILSYDMSVADINNCIEGATADFYAEYTIVSPNDIVYEVIKEITKASNTLWGEEWDFEQESFIFPYSNITSRSIEAPSSNDNDNNDNNGNNNNQESEEEKKKNQEQLKKADKTGAKEGAEVGITLGAIGGFGSAVGGCALGAAIGGLVYSAVEFVIQSSETKALQMESEQVIPNSYLHRHLRFLHETEPVKYNNLYGNKFDSIL